MPCADRGHDQTARRGPMTVFQDTSENFQLLFDQRVSRYREPSWDVSGEQPEGPARGLLRIAHNDGDQDQTIMRATMATFQKKREKLKIFFSHRVSRCRDPSGDVGGDQPEGPALNFFVAAKDGTGMCTAAGCDDVESTDALHAASAPGRTIQEFSNVVSSGGGFSSLTEPPLSEYPGLQSESWAEAESSTPYVTVQNGLYESGDHAILKQQFWGIKEAGDASADTFQSRRETVRNLLKLRIGGGNTQPGDKHTLCPSAERPRADRSRGTPSYVRMASSLDCHQNALFQSDLRIPLRQMHPSPLSARVDTGIDSPPDINVTDPMLNEHLLTAPVCQQINAQPQFQQYDKSDQRSGDDGLHLVTGRALAYPDQTGHGPTSKPPFVECDHQDAAGGSTIPACVALPDPQTSFHDTSPQATVLSGSVSSLSLRQQHAPSTTMQAATPVADQAHALIDEDECVLDAPVWGGNTPQQKASRYPGGSQNTIAHHYVVAHARQEPTLEGDACVEQLLDNHGRPARPRKDGWSMDHARISCLNARSESDGDACGLDTPARGGDIAGDMCTAYRLKTPLLSRAAQLSDVDAFHSRCTSQLCLADQVLSPEAAQRFRECLSTDLSYILKAQELVRNCDPDGFKILESPTFIQAHARCQTICQQLVLRLGQYGAPSEDMRGSIDNFAEMRTRLIERSQAYLRGFRTVATEVAQRLKEDGHVQLTRCMYGEFKGFCTMQCLFLALPRGRLCHYAEHLGLTAAEAKEGLRFNTLIRPLKSVQFESSYTAQVQPSGSKQTCTSKWKQQSQRRQRHIRWFGEQFNIKDPNNLRPAVSLLATHWLKYGTRASSRWKNASAEFRETLTCVYVKSMTVQILATLYGFGPEDIPDWMWEDNLRDCGALAHCGLRSLFGDQGGPPRPAENGMLLPRTCLRGLLMHMDLHMLGQTCSD
eukprot:jgi/Ulvmu1/12285/UM087_0019.1